MRGVRQEGVDFRILIRQDQERVFDCIASAKGLDEWFTTNASLDPRPGGRIMFRWENWGLDDYTGEIPGSVVEYSRPQRFVFQWRADSGGYDTTAEFNFRAAEEGTLVHVREFGYQDGPEGMQDLLNRVSGWAHVLTLLKFYLEHGAHY